VNSFISLYSRTLPAGLPMINLRSSWGVLRLVDSRPVLHWARSAPGFLAALALSVTLVSHSQQALADLDNLNESDEEETGFFDSLEYRGNLAAELSVFTAESETSAEQRSNLSLSGEVELYYPLNDEGSKSIIITPFFRLDEHDAERTHFDFREFLYQQNSDNWEIRVGLGKVFWGVAESRNVVDIINQRDLVEGIISDEKLGQPMIQFSWIRDSGSLDVFILPGFRLQTTPGVDGRPRGATVIRNGDAIFESGAEELNTDFALRYSTVVDDWDLGFSFFNGTARDPLLQPLAAGSVLTTAPSADSLTTISLLPFYHQITQVGVDAQATLESWLLKFEGIYQVGDNIEDHFELVGGFEYSFYGIFDTDTDLGIVTEYLFDDRSTDATQPFQNDLLFGLRLALNDEQSSEALLGTIVDLESNSASLTFEASRRIGNSFKLSANAVFWVNTGDDSILDLLRSEDYLQLELAWFF